MLVPCPLRTPLPKAVRDTGNICDQKVRLSTAFGFVLLARSSYATHLPCATRLLPWKGRRYQHILPWYVTDVKLPSVYLILYKIQIPLRTEVHMEPGFYRLHWRHSSCEGALPSFKAKLPH